MARDSHYGEERRENISSGQKDKNKYTVNYRVSVTRKPHTEEGKTPKTNNKRTKGTENKEQGHSQIPVIGTSFFRASYKQRGPANVTLEIFHHSKREQIRKNGP